MIASNGCSLASATDFILQWPQILSRYHKDTGKFSPACRVSAADHSSGNHTAFKRQSGSLQFKPWCWLDQNKIWSPQKSWHHQAIRNIDDKIHDTEGQILVHYEILNHPVEGKTVHSPIRPCYFVRLFSETMRTDTLPRSCQWISHTAGPQSANFLSTIFIIMVGFIC